MEKPFRLDGDVYRQLSIINRLELRADLTVQSLYAKAVLEHSLYHFREQHLKNKSIRRWSNVTNRHFIH